jgi:hypothetical protein
MKEIGDELVKKAIKLVYDTTIEGIEAFADKKISLSEILGFSDNVYSIAVMATKWDEFVAQVKDIDSDEGLELAEYTASLIKDATGDEIDIIIDNAIQIVTKEIAIYNENILPIIAVIRK